MFNGFMAVALDCRNISLKLKLPNLSSLIITFYLFERSSPMCCLIRNVMHESQQVPPGIMS